MPVACVLAARCTHAARRCLLVYYARASMLLRLLRGGSAVAAPRCFPAAVLEPRRTGTKPCAPAAIDAARRQCRRRSSLLLSSGTRAAARWYEALSARSGGCCAEVVPPPRLAASQQRRASCSAPARSRALPRRWLLRGGSAAAAPRCWFPAAALEPHRAGARPCIPAAMTAAWRGARAASRRRREALRFPRRWLQRGGSVAAALCCFPAAVLEPQRAGAKPRALRRAMAAARRQCRRRASLLLSSGARAAARWHEALRARGDGCRAAAVPSSLYTLLLSSGARAAARWHEAARFRGDSCCAAAVPPPCLSAPRQRRSSRCTGKEPCSPAAMAPWLLRCGSASIAMVCYTSAQRAILD
eukprot:scaffold41657_cov69-Phaeocystis_antarctica.AAC.2